MNEETNTMDSKNDIRLPTTVRPILYNIALAPDLENFSFTGEESIDIEVLQETSRITLHAADLLIHSASYSRGGKTLTPTSITADTTSQQITLNFEKNLPKGAGKLTIAFSGVLNDQMAGFYRSSYEVGGQTKIMATTQFEDSDARRAFPCWDEPAVKARFNITLEIPKDCDALSNMFPENIALSPTNHSKKIVSFATTPIMSTYLVTFIVGELEHIEAVTKHGTLVRVFATPGKKEQGQCALECGVKCLEFYENYFDVSYPLPKLDMVAIPDFAADAMEGWGLVTYRETAVLYNPALSSLARKQRVAIVVAHELAHMWFGDLVTMEWWTQLWLNEGFATWMEYLAVDHMFPDWNIWDQFVASSFTEALADDGLRSTHPIEMVIHHPSELRQSFDSISYEKGACIIRMIHNYLGEDEFCQGLRLYIKRHAYQNATTEDLWQALEEISGKPIRDIMDTWTKQPGYPVVTIQERIPERFVCRQSRFIGSGATLLPEETKQRWYIPIAYVTKYDKNPWPLLLPRDQVLWEFIHQQNKQWIKLNANQITCTRVAYPPSLQQALHSAVTNKDLSSVDRLGLLNDLYALVQAGLAPTTQLLSFLEAYIDEDAPEVWEELLKDLAGIAHLLTPGSNTKRYFDSYAQTILAQIVRKKGWEEALHETHTHKLLRPKVLAEYGKYGHLSTAQEALLRFNRFLENPDTLNPNLRPHLYCMVAHFGDTNTHETLLSCYHKADRQEEKVALLNALGHFQDRALLQNTLNFALTDKVRSQDTMFVFESVAKNIHGHTLAWEFLKQEWSTIYSRYRDSLTLLSRIIDSSAGALHSHEHALDVETFFSAHQLPEASRTITNSLERIRTRAGWISRDRKQIEEWLALWASHNNVLHKM